MARPHKHAIPYQHATMFADKLVEAKSSPFFREKAPKGKFPFEDRSSNSAQKKQTVDFHTRVDVIKNLKQCKTI